MEFTNSSSTGSNYQSTYSVGNDSSSFQQTNPAHSNQSDGDMPSSVSDQPNQEDEGPDSSIENVIPLQKLKRGWFAVSGFVMNKASEVYNSEQVQHIKQKTAEVVVPALEKTAEVVKPAWEKTTEVVTPAWQKTVDAATPLWEQTKATTSVVIEKTRENVNIATEKVKPTVKNVSTQMFPLCICMLLFSICVRFPRMSL